MIDLPDAAHPVTRRTALAGGLAAAALAAYPMSAEATALPTGVAPHTSGRPPKGVDHATLMTWARDTWTSLVAMTDPRTGLVSDNITGDLAAPGVYTSPTNIGGYLWSAVVARDLRIITPAEASRRIGQTLETLQGMQHHTASGMYYNWYDPRDASVIYDWPDNGDPVVPFVSSVDAAWLGAALLVVRNSDRRNAKVAGAMFKRMRFDVFADPTFSKPYLNYGGFYLEEPTRLNAPPPTIARDLIGAGEPVWYTADHHYDTAVSETRITTYLAIAKQQVPASTYYQTWRTFPPEWDWQELIPEGKTRTYLGVDVYEGAYHYYDRWTVPGWGGSMFEELMPDVFVPEADWAPRSWGRNHPNHVAVQRQHGLDEYGYWGFSPASHPLGGYSEWGVDALGLKPDGYFSDIEHTDHDRNDTGKAFGNGVVTPHASFLAMMHAPREAFDNLVNIRSDFDAYGPGGFYDAIATQTGDVARRHLSLDQAMIMGALGNVMTRDNLRRYFSAGEVKRYVRPVIAPEIFGPGD
ncbi:MAG: glucoamylase family protein [Ornithinimicrobium sp.]|uniref:glucoamylase family protein n=1 Tax=Ornithinimicrobium sp. TaxID=1977084 RepID=UPI0026DFC76A|nr:glucoamylase family protein [Ornithinimicrobium sp.]MDO5740135.1 glucoamylase family protein [Ornithinimicrobium sp.]